MCETVNCAQLSLSTALVLRLAPLAEYYDLWPLRQCLVDWMQETKSEETLNDWVGADAMAAIEGWHGGTYAVEWSDAVLDRLIKGVCANGRKLRAAELQKLECLRGSTVVAVLKRFATTQPTIKVCAIYSCSGDYKRDSAGGYTRSIISQGGATHSEEARAHATAWSIVKR